MTVTTTSRGTTGRSAVRSSRGPILLGVGLVVVLALLAAMTAGGRTGYLDPDAYDPSGSHAVSALLDDRGVDVRVVHDLPETTAAATAETTTFVPLPELLSDDELDLLADLPGRLVVNGGGRAVAAALVPGLLTRGPIDVEDRDPACSVVEAANAGRALLGGTRYQQVDGAVRCYHDTLIALPSARRTLVGDGHFMTNERLGEQGNAALALGLLGQSPTVLWLMVDPLRADIGTKPVQDPGELLPDWVGAVELELLLAVLLLALWRGRRLGRVVAEPLPVVVPAAETTEGRGRLYRATGARGTAAEALRQAARERLAQRLGAPPGTPPASLVSMVASRASRSETGVHALLYGPQPADDDALVRLAGHLDSLTREVLHPRPTPPPDTKAS